MMMALRSLPTLLLLCSLTLASHVKVHDCDVQSAYVGDQSQGLPKSDLSNPNLTTDHEPMAIEQYEAMTGNTVTRVGMIQSEREPMLTVSPDGLVGDDGAVEVKCPKTKTHVRYIRMGVIPVEYRPQVLQYFLVHDKLQWLDFISFDPRLERKPIWVKRVTRAELRLEIDDAWAMVDKFVKKFNKYKEEIWF